MENKIYKNAPSKFETLVCQNAHLVVTPESNIKLPFLNRDEISGANAMPEYVGKFKCWAIVVWRHTKEENGAIDYLRNMVDCGGERPYDDAIYCEVWDMFYDNWSGERPTLTKLFDIIHKYVGENITRKEFNKIVKHVKVNPPKGYYDKYDIYELIYLNCIEYAEEKERPLVEQTIQEIKAQYNLDEIQEPYWNLEQKIKESMAN